MAGIYAINVSHYSCSPDSLWPLKLSPDFYTLEVDILSFENIQDFHSPWICLMWLTFRAELRAISALCDLPQLPLMLSFFFFSGLCAILFKKSSSGNVNKNAKMALRLCSPVVSFLKIRDESWISQTFIIAPCARKRRGGKQYHMMGRGTILSGWGSLGSMGLPRSRVSPAARARQLTCASCQLAHDPLTRIDRRLGFSPCYLVLVILR